MKAFLLRHKGFSLILSIMMVTFILLLVVFLSALSTGQITFTGGSTDSARAFSAADAGIEYALSRINLGLQVGGGSDPCVCGASPPSCPATPLVSQTQFCVTADNPNDPRKIVAVGRTIDTNIRRSLEVLVPAFAAVNTFNTICVPGTTSGITSLNLNAFCVNEGYAGATGVMGSSGSSCTTVKTPFVGQTVDGSDINVTVTGLGATNFYAVQCYR